MLLVSTSLSIGDKTVEDRAVGKDVVCAVINNIDDSGIFPDDNGILRRIAWIESKFGNDHATFRHEYYGGIWQIDAGKDGAFTEITKNAKNHTQLNNVIIPKLNAKFGINITNVKYEELLKPLYSGLFARIRLYITRDAIPENYDLIGQANYWKTKYNSVEGKGSPEKFIEDVQEMEKEYGQFCDNCKGRMNLAIVMDKSRRIGYSDDNIAKSSVVKMLDTFSIEFVDVGLVAFSSFSSVIFPLKSNLTRELMKTRIEASGYPGGSTRTDLGINNGIRIQNNADTKVGVPKVMVILTNGRPDSESKTLIAAANAARSNITLFAIGIGSSIDKDFLLKMAKSPSRVVSITSYNALNDELL